MSQLAQTISMSATVEVEKAGMRLDQVAAALFPQYSRSRLQSWIKQGALCVDGQQQRPRDKVPAGANLQLVAELEAEVHWQAQDIALDIVHEDEYLVVINKAPGVVVHPGAGRRRGSHARLHARLGTYPSGRRLRHPAPRGVAPRRPAPPPWSAGGAASGIA